MSSEKFLNSRFRLKKIRKELKISSQIQFARELSVSVHKIKDVEGGKIRLSAEVASLIEDKYGYAMRWLLAGKGPEKLSEGRDISDYAPMETGDDRISREMHSPELEMNWLKRGEEERNRLTALKELMGWLLTIMERGDAYDISLLHDTMLNLVRAIKRRNMGNNEKQEKTEVVKEEVELKQEVKKEEG